MVLLLTILVFASLLGQQTQMSYTVTASVLVASHLEEIRSQN